MSLFCFQSMSIAQAFMFVKIVVFESCLQSRRW